MCRGDFEAAWRISDRALYNRDHFARSSGNVELTWRGEPLDGKRVMVRCCYGLGDTLQFVRYVPSLRRAARHVTVHAQASVARVLEHVEGIDSLVTRYNNVPPESYDVAIELSELPHVFRTTPQTIPAQIPYIHVTPRSFPATNDINVGLMWQGSDWDPRRSRAAGIIRRIRSHRWPHASHCPARPRVNGAANRFWDQLRTRQFI